MGISGQSAHATPEIELLLCCAGVRDEPERVARARRLIECDFDWDHAMTHAVQFGMTPLLHRFLSTHCEDLLPSNVAGGMRTRAAMNELRCRALTREMVRLYRAFDRERIDLIVLKGPVLALIAYGDVTMRQFTDIDLLIHHADLERAAALLAAEGYQPRLDRPGALLGDFFQSSEDVFSGRDGISHIDLHWRLTPRYFPYAPPLDLCWRRSIMVEVDGFEVRSLGPAEQVLFVSVHAGKHGWSSLDSVVDIAHLIDRFERRGVLDWEALIDDAKRFGSERLLLVAAALARDLMGAPIPAAVCRALSDDRASEAIAVRVANRLLTGATPVGEDWRLPLALIVGWDRRMTYIIDRMMAPTVDDWEFCRLPRPLFPLYYLIRPVRLAIQRLGARKATQPLA
jgi:hypothetical protein